MDKVNTLKELLISSEKNYSKNTAFYLKDKGGAIFEVTYEKFRGDCECLGTALIYELQAKGKNVAIFMANSYQWCVSYLAIAGGVGIVVPLDKELPSQEFYNIAEFAEIDTVITDSNGYKIISMDKERKKSLKIITVGDAEYPDTISFDELNHINFHLHFLYQKTTPTNKMYIQLRYLLRPSKSNHPYSFQGELNQRNRNYFYLSTHKMSQTGR